MTLRYAVPAGALGRAVARYFGEEPSQQLDDDLRRFKQAVETGRSSVPRAPPRASGPAASSPSTPPAPSPPRN